MISLGLALHAAMLLPLTGAAQENRRLVEDESTRIFALPMVRDTRELAAAAEDHLRSERWAEAVQALQRILEGHAQEVLPPALDAAQMSTYPGAAEWALERMFALPEIVRNEYRARFEPRAREALARARGAPTRSALVAIPRQWPLVESAVLAWWTLGDLEFEAGQADSAELAWRQALALSERLGMTLEPGPVRLEWLRRRQPASRTSVSAPPRGDAEAWTTPLDLTPFVRGSIPIGKNLQPISSGDTVLVGTTLRLYALDAFTGEPRWQAGPPKGWGMPGASIGGTQLFDGINFELYLTPAVGDGVALAVLQEPFTENDNEQWQGIPIMTAIPERRLHAFDLESGRELWNHAPRLTYDGLRQQWDGSGTYAQRMMVAGSPIVVGARVLVPCYRMQGRIDYHVACYELHTGELLWSTLVISGQRERNMFGRPVREFSAAPLVVSGDHVVAQTELGTVAALNLFTGHIQWQAVYRQIPLPKTKNYSAPPRPLTWRLAPPVVVGEWVVTTPSDSNEILGLRLADGAKLWAYTENSLQALHRESAPRRFDLLLGADEDTLYLSGEKVSALQKPGGLGSSSPFFPLWTKLLDKPDSAPRAVLTSETVLAPSALRRVAFERRTGSEIPALSGSWNRGEAGALWLEEGALFSLSSQGLSGYFDWAAQLERARRMARPGAGAAELSAAAELFLRRGRLSTNEGALESARSALEEARAIFARLYEQGAEPSTRDELECARTLAEVLTGLRRDEPALELLHQARSLAGTRAELAALLFQEERILRARGGPTRIAILDEIESCWGALTLPNETAEEAAARWLTSSSPGEPLTPAPDPIPTVLWTAVERAAEHERAGLIPLALVDLHTALGHARGVNLARGQPATAYLRGYITRLRALPGGLEAYAPIEERATTALAHARAADDPAELEAVCETYPHSDAADQALGLLLTHALAGRDPRTVVALVGRALARGGLGAEREIELTLVLARAMGQQGNTALERALVGALARAQPAFVPELPAYAGRNLLVLAEDLAKEAADPAPSPVTFDSSVVSTGRSQYGPAMYLGALRQKTQVAESAPLELHLYATKQELLAFANSAPGEPLWKRALARPPEGLESNSAIAPGCFLYATREEFVCLDERGEERWTRPIQGSVIRAVKEANGVAVLLGQDGTVQAFDSWLGLPLWERTLGPAGNWSGPVLGDGHAAFFSVLPSTAPRAIVLDLFRGRVSADFRLNGFDSRTSLERTAWISADRLITPSFQTQPSQLAAFALDGGRRAWTIEFGRDEAFHAVVHCEGGTFPVTLAAALGSSGNGGVYELDENTGTIRRVVPLKPGERLMGIDGGSSITLTDPYLFAYSYSDSESSVPIRALHLPYGILWSWSLTIRSQEIYDGSGLPMPAVSADCVAIACPLRGASGPETTIVFVDKRAGKRVDTRTLVGSFAQANRVELRGLGQALFILAKGPPRGTCLEILEKLR